MTTIDELNHNAPQTEETQSQESNTQGPDYKELYLRTQADLQNMKRRMEKERLEWTPTVQASILEKILPCAEDLDRAIETARTSNTDAPQAWLEGFELIAKNLKKTLASLGVEEIVATGQFNPELHEALMQVQSADHASGMIVQQLSKGFTFKGKVLKHARVSVAQ